MASSPQETGELGRAIRHIGMTSSLHRNSELKGTLKLDEPMARHTSWRAGGKADRYYIPADLQDLRDFLASRAPEEPLLMLGLGSNLLVRDGGFHGTVIAVSGVLADLGLGKNGVINAGAGVSCAKLARFSVRNGLTGAEFLAGIPGTVGGALAMNAGAFGGETWGIAGSAITVNRSGRLQSRSRTELRPEYRRVHLPEGEWFVSAEFQLVAGNSAQGEQRMRELLALRARTQPVGGASCGSVFRNPPGDSAGRLIDACRLKGLRSGNAIVSDHHANFIINCGGATAGDIERLISIVQQKVHESFGIQLEPEVRIVGQH